MTVAQTAYGDSTAVLSLAGLRPTPVVRTPHPAREQAVAGQISQAVMLEPSRTAPTRDLLLQDRALVAIKVASSPFASRGTGISTDPHFGRLFLIEAWQSSSAVCQPKLGLNAFFSEPSPYASRTAEFSDIVLLTCQVESDELCKPNLLEGFEQYQSPNWDGYGAEPVTPETVTAAREALSALDGLIEMPEIAPGADGGIGFEWIFETGPVRKLFIDIGPGRTWSAYWRLLSGERGKVPHKQVGASLGSEFEHVLSKLGLANADVRW